MTDRMKFPHTTRPERTGHDSYLPILQLTHIGSRPQPGQWEKQQWDFLELRRIRMSGMPEGTLGRPGHVGTQERPDDRHQEQLGKSDAWKRSLADRLCMLLVLMSGSRRPGQVDAGIAKTHSAGFEEELIPLLSTSQAASIASAVCTAFSLRS